MSDMIFNPTGGSFSGVQPMKSVDKLSYLNSIEDCMRYTGDMSIGNFYPVRLLPSRYIDMDAEWPIVLAAGDIVAIKNIKDANAYTSDDDATGILTSGEVYVTEGVDGTSYKKSIGLVYSRPMAGFITRANGGTAKTYNYTDNDGTYGIINMSGEAVDSSLTYTNPANKPVGIVTHRVYADMRLRYLNYEVGQSGNAILINGVMTVPYVAVYGGSEEENTKVIDAIKSAVNAKHQYFYTSDQSSLTNVEANMTAPGTLLKPDDDAKFTVFDSNSDDSDQQFGKVLNIRNRVPYDMNAIVDSFPGSGMKGTDTAGLSSRLYNFVKSALAPAVVRGSSYAATKANIRNALHTPVTTATGSVSVIFGQVDIAFGV